MMQERETRLYNRAFGAGGEGLRTRMGRVMANPEFQRWAADNGYELGQSQIDADGNVSYVPGPQDERALLRFAEQARTGRQGGLFERRRTDELVRVTITNPEERQRLLEANDLGGGRYAVDPRSGSLLSSQAYIEGSRKSGLVPQGYQAAYVDGTTYIKALDGSISALIQGELLPVVRPPEGLQFKDAIVYGPNDTVRYMTAEDMTNPPAAGDIGYPDENDKRAIEKSSPYKIVTAEQLPNVGVQTFVGYRDKRNAKTIGEMGEGAFSIDKGRYTFGKDAKYEVIATDAEPVRGSARSARRAEREFERYGSEGLSREQVLAARAAEAPAPEVAASAPPSALRVAAGDSRPRQEALTRAGDTTPPPGVAPEAAPAAVAPRDDLFGGAGFGEVDVGGAAIPVPSALAPKPAALAPAKEEAVYFSKNGAVYKATPRGAVMIQPAEGKTLTMGVVPTDSDAFQALVEDAEPVDAEEGRSLETELATAPAIGRPTPEITAEGQVTRIDLGQRRPTLEQKIGDVAEKAKGAIAGLFAPKPFVSRGREGLPEAAPIGRENELFPQTGFSEISLDEGAPAPVTGAAAPPPAAARPLPQVPPPTQPPAPAVTPAPPKPPESAKKAALRQALEEAKGAAAGRQGFLAEASSALRGEDLDLPLAERGKAAAAARRAEGARLDAGIAAAKAAPVDPFTEPTDDELYKEAERRVSAAQEAEGRRAARKEKLGKFLGTMAAAFGRKPGATAATMPTTPTNGAR
jgi:hypothetical protein